MANASAPGFPQALLDAIEAAVCVVAGDGEVVMANEHSRRLLGRDLTGENIASGDYEEEVPLLAEAVECYRRRRDAWETEHDLVSCAHEEGARFYWIGIGPMGDLDSPRSLRIMMLQDITGLLTASPHLNKILSQLRHDLRSPLTSIGGAAELLLSGRVGPLRGPQGRLVEIVMEGVAKIGEILRAKMTQKTEKAAGESR